MLGIEPSDVVAAAGEEAGPLILEFALRMKFLSVLLVPIVSVPGEVAAGEREESCWGEEVAAGGRENRADREEGRRRRRGVVQGDQERSWLNGSNREGEFGCVKSRGGPKY